MTDIHERVREIVCDADDLSTVSTEIWAHFDACEACSAWLGERADAEAEILLEACGQSSAYDAFNQVSGGFLTAEPFPVDRECFKLTRRAESRQVRDDLRARTTGDLPSVSSSKWAEDSGLWRLSALDRAKVTSPLHEGESYEEDLKPDFRTWPRVWAQPSIGVEVVLDLDEDENEELVVVLRARSEEPARLSWKGGSLILTTDFSSAILPRDLVLSDPWEPESELRRGIFTLEI